MSDEPPRIAFTQHSKVAQSIWLLGLLQGFVAVLAVCGIFIPDTNKLALGTIAGVCLSSSLMTIGFSYLVEHAARELTRMDRE